MTSRHRLSNIALTVIAAAASAMPAVAVPNLGMRPTGDNISQSRLLQLADARSYWHCHNRPRRPITCRTTPIQCVDTRSYEHCHNRPRRLLTCHTKEPLW